ncbi:hypothetical protein MUP77_25045 [Candidatus Bathyarchaeota archaeon]|nr:hypothetical protein [Candidatus Bathyarchaeota archaeon]
MNLSRAVLIDLREKCFSKRIWFSSLSSIERSLVNLTIRVVDEVKSSRLNSLLGAIVRRLEEALESPFLKAANLRGLSLVERFVNVAYSWGYATALDWLDDKSYILYLGVSSLNTPNAFRTLP